MVRRRKKICPKCGRSLWLRDFYKTANGRVSSACKECTRQEKRDEYARNRKVPNQLYQDPVTGRLMEHKDYSTKIHWSLYMIERLTNKYATTKNEDLAIDLNVSPSTVIRKARELGLEKDEGWMQAHARKNCRTMRILNKYRGNSGQIKKGEHRSPETEFKKRNL